MQKLRKPSICPKCGKTDIRRIIGGRPTPEAWEMVKRDEAVIGSSFSFYIKGELNDWRCMNCNHEWYDPTDPARQEMEALLKKIFRKHGLKFEIGNQ